MWGIFLDFGRWPVRIVFARWWDPNAQSTLVARTKRKCKKRQQQQQTEETKSEKNKDSPTKKLQLFLPFHIYFRRFFSVLKSVCCCFCFLCFFGVEVASKWMDGKYPKHSASIFSRRCRPNAQKRRKAHSHHHQRYDTIICFETRMMMTTMTITVTTTTKMYKDELESYPAAMLDVLNFKIPYGIQN